MAKQQAFVYRPPTPEAIKKRQDQSGGLYDSYIKSQYTGYKMKADNLIRPMPPTFEGAEHYGMDIWVHHNVGADNGSYLCAAKMLGESCCICDALVPMARSDPEAAKELKAGKRVLMWLIDRDDESKGPQLVAMPWSLDRDINLLTTNKRTGEIFYLDNPEEGHDVSFNRTGKGVQTKYVGIQIAQRSSPLSTDDATFNDWIAFIQENPLPDVLHYYDQEYIAKVFSGGKSEDNGDEQPATRHAGRVPAKAPARPAGRIPVKMVEPIDDPDESLDGPFEEESEPDIIDESYIAEQPDGWQVGDNVTYGLEDGTEAVGQIVSVTDIIALVDDADGNRMQVPLELLSPYEPPAPPKPVAPARPIARPAPARPAPVPARPLAARPAATPARPIAAAPVARQPMARTAPVAPARPAARPAPIAARPAPVRPVAAARPLAAKPALSPLPRRAPVAVAGQDDGTDD